jgi:hypothetical protein
LSEVEQHPLIFVAEMHVLRTRAKKDDVTADDAAGEAMRD